MWNLQSGKVDERHLKVAKICVNNIGLLMQRSRCELPPEMPAEGESSAPLPPVVLDPTEITVKAAIARTVAEQYRKVGRTIEGEELNKIVDRFVFPCFTCKDLKR